jgi:hypothetical protein
MIVDRLQLLEKEIAALKTLASRLSEEVAQLRHELRLQKHPVEAFLSQRGLPVMAHGERGQLLLPPNATLEQKERFYDLLKRYSFRLFLRDLIQFPQGADFSVLSRYCSSKTVRSYLGSLSELGIAEFHEDKSYRLIPSRITSFGLTLEWFVSELFQREFLSPSLFNVRLEQTRYGGDYDVIALLAGYLVYVEVKSSPPRGVEQPAVSAFLNRLEDLQPHLAIFLVDTELRMKDKIALLFAEALQRKVAENEPHRPVVRLVDEIFHIGHGIYLINSRKGIYSNIRLCFRDFLRRGKGNRSRAEE